MLVNSTAFVATDGTFIVFIDCEIDKKAATFILHAEGNMRQVVSLFREAEHLLCEDIYFEMQGNKFFKRHAELVSSIDGQEFYRLKGVMRCRC